MDVMTIVLGYVPTAEGDAALTFAIEEAQLRDAQVVLVNSSRGDAPVDERLAPAERIDQIRMQAAGAGITLQVRQPVRGRDGASEILAAAEDVAANMIVIGVRRRSPVGKLLMGSVALDVLSDAGCPVVAVRS
jgi:nucleotide-binding universal stress UspA family protein